LAASALNLIASAWHGFIDATMKPPHFQEPLLATTAVALQLQYPLDIREQDTAYMVELAYRTFVCLGVVPLAALQMATLGIQDLN